MGIIYFVGIAVAGAVLLGILVWGGRVAYRRFFARAPRRVPARAVRVQQGAPVLVGARQIRQEQRDYFSGQAPAPYHYARGRSGGFPQNWHEDLWRRRN